MKDGTSAVAKSCFFHTIPSGGTVNTHTRSTPKTVKRREYKTMAGIFTRPEVSKILTDENLTPLSDIGIIPIKYVSPDSVTEALAKYF